MSDSNNNGGSNGLADLVMELKDERITFAEMTRTLYNDYMSDPASPQEVSFIAMKLHTYSPRFGTGKSTPTFNNGIHFKRSGKEMTDTEEEAEKVLEDHLLASIQRTYGSETVSVFWDYYMRLMSDISVVIGTYDANKQRVSDSHLSDDILRPEEWHRARDGLHELNEIFKHARRSDRKWKAADFENILPEYGSHGSSNGETDDHPVRAAIMSELSSDDELTAEKIAKRRGYEIEKVRGHASYLVRKGQIESHGSSPKTYTLS